MWQPPSTAARRPADRPRRGPSRKCRPLRKKQARCHSRTTGLPKRAKGFEPSTSSLGSWHSTIELRPHGLRCSGHRRKHYRRERPGCQVLLCRQVSFSRAGRAARSDAARRYRRGYALTGTPRTFTGRRSRCRACRSPSGRAPVWRRACRFAACRSVPFGPSLWRPGWPGSPGRRGR